MKYKALKDIATITMGQSPDSSSYNEERNGIPFYQGNADFGEIYPTARVWCSNPKKIAKKNDILISVRAPIGALNYATEECCIGRGLAAITIENDSERKYVFHFLKAQNKELNHRGTGSTFKAISKSVLEEIQVPVIAKEQQEIIMNLIDIIEQIIRQRKQELRRLEDLTKSRFIEMFGDPVGNPKGWTMVPLGTRCEIITGNTPSRAETKNYGEFIEWIKSDNINTPYTFLTEAQEYLSEIGFQKCRFVEAGSLLMTCIAGSVNCIGNVAVADRRVAFNQQINAIVPNEDEVLYLYWLMLLSKPEIHRTINMALKGILSKRQLSEMMFPFPPVALQKQFVIFVEQTDKSKVIIQKSLDETQLLFDSLMQKYFG